MSIGESDKLLTLTEVSDLLKVHPNTLRNWDKKRNPKSRENWNQKDSPV